MDFILTGLTDRTRIILPVNPPKVTVTEGARAQTFEVLELGGVTLSRGRNPVRISWDGLLPGIDRQGYLPRLREAFTEPEFVIATFQMWLNYGRHVRLNVTETYIQWPRLQVTTLTHHRSGAFGDIEYSLELTEVRPFIVRLDSPTTTDETGTTVTPPEEASPAEEGNPSGEEVPTAYEVKPGDSLWAVAKQVYGDGSRWQEIYQANADVIGPDPSVITPGQSLRIPGGTPPKSE